MDQDAELAVPVLAVELDAVEAVLLDVEEEEVEDVEEFVEAVELEVLAAEAVVLHLVGSPLLMPLLA